MRAGSLDIDDRQRQQNVRFVRAYEAKTPPSSPSSPSSPSRPRVLVSAFGPFPPHAINASAEVLATLAGVPPHRAELFEAGDERDTPGRHVRVDDVTIGLDDDAPCDLRAVILPVFWDVAPFVLVREIAAFRPDVVLMTGVAGDAQPIHLERGARNVRSSRLDASLRASPRGPALLPGAAVERLVPFPFDEARRAAVQVLDRALAATPTLASVTTTVQVAAPRDDNAYLCNQVTYLVDHALAHGGETLALLRSSDAAEGVSLALPEGLQDVPRAFVHWPSRIGEHRDAGAAMLRALLAVAVASRVSRLSPRATECARPVMR